MPPQLSIHRFRKRSLVRAILLALGAFVLSLRLGGFPDINALHSTRWQLFPILLAVGAMLETARCLDRKWSLYHAGVLLLLYTDLMVLALAIFLFFFP